MHHSSMQATVKNRIYHFQLTSVSYTPKNDRLGTPPRCNDTGV